MSKIVPSPLYRWEHEHDACGVGFIAHTGGEASYDILDYAVTALKNVAHRGAVDADAVTGDGAGIMTQLPIELFQDYLQSIGKKLYDARDLGVGMLFLPRDDEYARNRCKHFVEEATKKEGLTFLAWREVPVNAGVLGRTAEVTRPTISQALIVRNDEDEDAVFERKLYLIHKAAERQAHEQGIRDFYVCSFSSKTLTYKGLLNAPQIRRFFLDLRSPLYKTAFAIFHQRFATNTLPDWAKAQPFRMMAHNGEINTVRGNRNAMRAREFSANHGVWGDRYADVRPLIQPEMSDSASFDNALQFVTLGGRSSIHAASMMMPSAWEKDIEIADGVRDFYHFHSLMAEPWDGPAAITFSDGRFVAVSLDRNGLRPMRYKQFDNGLVVAGSEVGLIPQIPARAIRSGRLGPGHMIAVDIQEKRFLEDADVQDYIAGLSDYGDYVATRINDLHKLAGEGVEFTSSTPEGDLVSQQVAFGYELDEREIVLLPMMQTGAEAIGSMGDDTPLAVLSRRPRLLYTYFKQLFAQVTNPPIDPIRESLVMSLNMHLGGRLGLFDGLENDRHFLEVESPCLMPHEFAAISSFEPFAGKVTKLQALFEASSAENLEPALKKLARDARAAVEGGARILVISDRGVSREHAPMPMLLATGAVHQELVRAGLRMDADLVCETAEARDVHQFACLLGYGANAIYPYLAFDVLASLTEAGEGVEGVDVSTGLKNYRKAIDKGLLKIMSKMGISTLFSYHGAQIFEALGLSSKVVDECFFGTATPIGGIGYTHIAEETLARHQTAFPAEGEVELIEEGYYKVKKKGDGEFHGWNPKVVAGMNRFLKKEGEYEAFETYRTAADEHTPLSIKDLLKFRFSEKQVELAEVEPIESIRKRFTTAGMSLGALSPETHEALAIAMNRIGGKSNSGEGGEDQKRFTPYENGDLANSAIKQVASGRFGVSAEYLANATEIEIKIAQGAKPGEGGQLPGHKVTELIAKLRHSVPGVMLISPPPHHDIYSIEDLAQLIFDLKEVNPRAKVCVKLVACSGVGTVAAGVAKAYADVILISGHDGGTGASPISSIKNAGSAWEIGLAEAHQILMMNGLRNRVILRTDGGMKTGRDIVTAALLGAEEYNFGTAALIAAGCAMFRVCHLNSCPVGVATQREDLRAKFRGKPENIIHYFNAVAEDVRRLLGKLGAKSLEDVIGRTDLLEQIDDPSNPKTKTINFAGLLHNPDPSGDAPRIHTRERNDSPGHEGSLDHQILQDARFAIKGKIPVFNGFYPVRNVNRDVGTRLAGEVGFLLGNKGLKPGTINLTFKGSAGQAFGTFLVQGIRLHLIGEANDYVGKGMNGGEIIIHPKPETAYDWHQNIIIGNTCLYGATGGFLFAAGDAGERLGVRNSGATAVVEGAGDHCCEYMTGGTVVVIGSTGRNFGAGMSGGLAFVYDDEDKLEKRYNPEMVDIERLDNNDEIDSLKRLIELHTKLTGSRYAQNVLDNWTAELPKFWRVVPKPSTPEARTPVFSFGQEMEAIPAG